MDRLEENTVYLYAEYKINDETKCQVIPSGNISDLIYEEGMKEVCFKNIIYDDGVLIDCTLNNSGTYSLGIPVISKEFIEMYENNDLRIKKGNTINDAYEYFKENHLMDANLIIMPNNQIIFNLNSKSVMPKINGEPIYISKSDIIKGNNYWYIELHEGNSVKYEKTYLGDKKYRGQKCDYYSFVLVTEYQVDGKEMHKIIHRDKTNYLYSEYNPSKLDLIIDQAKALLESHDYKFKDFSGVTPLYRFNSEDSACVFMDNKSLITGQNVVTVTGSGDAILDLFMNGAKKIVSFDINSMAAFWAELKFVAAKYLNYQDYLNLINNLNYDIYSKISYYLNPNTKKLWDELYNFCDLREIRIDGEQSNLIYHTSFLSFDYSQDNLNGYCNEDNYYRLQKILSNKSISDVSFVTCDIFDLPNSADLSNYSYAYLSNIMDFLVGIDKLEIDESAVEKFKDFVSQSLLPSMKEDANIDLCYISENWHLGKSKKIYSEKFSEDEGYRKTPLSNTNCKASVLSFRSYLRKNYIQSTGSHRK